MGEWVERVYRLVDAKNADEYVSFLADDASFRYGNSDAVTGRQAIRQTLSEFFVSIAGLRHTFSARWEAQDAIILQGDVRYTRLDDLEVTLPFVTVYRLDARLARQVDIFIDPAPLFAS